MLTPEVRTWHSRLSQSRSPAHLLGLEPGFLWQLPPVGGICPDFCGQHSCKFSASTRSRRSPLAALRLQTAQTETTKRGLFEHTSRRNFFGDTMSEHEDLFWSECPDCMQAHCHFWLWEKVDPRERFGKYCRQLCMCYQVVVESASSTTAMELTTRRCRGILDARACH